MSGAYIRYRESVVLFAILPDRKAGKEEPSRLGMAETCVLIRVPTPHVRRRVYSKQSSGALKHRQGRYSARRPAATSRGARQPAAQASCSQ
jgi:hypothetical protein